MYNNLGQHQGKDASRVILKLQLLSQQISVFAESPTTPAPPQADRIQQLEMFLIDPDHFTE